MYAIKRRGFAMILAIVVVLLIAAGGALILSNAAKGTKSMGDNYLRAQAELLAESATEYAVMRAQGFDTSTGNCLNQLDITVQDAGGAAMYDANVTLVYSFHGTKPAACNGVGDTGKETTILMDTTVTTRAGANLSTEPIRVHKRSVQKL
ncbi:MAG: hypothetical protein JXK04_04430 [Campylobacterales bacterium]|nr:hypothetical protein [Campylobacterales bacterium]